LDVAARKISGFGSGYSWSKAELLVFLLDLSGIKQHFALYVVEINQKVLPT
jgi:hypothetical protein